MRNKEQRVGIFIDVQNLYHSAKNLYKARVNFKELSAGLLRPKSGKRPTNLSPLKKYQEFF